MDNSKNILYCIITKLKLLHTLYNLRKLLYNTLLQYKGTINGRTPKRNQIAVNTVSRPQQSINVTDEQGYWNQLSIFEKIYFRTEQQPYSFKYQKDAELFE